jgi:flagellar hook-associated protein 2
MAATSAIDGLISGLNTTQIIDAIMNSERQPAALLEEQETEKTKIISALKALQAKLVGLTSSVSVLSKASTYQASKIDVSDDTYLTAASSGRASAGSYDLQVLALARNHQIASQGFSDDSQSLFGTGTIKIAVGGGTVKTITIDATNNSLAGLKKAINDANIGVTASIISDGSAENPYRMVLTANKTGAANTISVTSDLTGGKNLNYSTATFDVPEWVSQNSGSTTQISLGGTAAYTGTTNKFYTFTVRGTGTKTVGTDNITLDWTDGTNSGSVVVSQADSEVDLAVPGAQGLKLSFSSGKLVGGDSFQVQTMAPLLQAASDARVSVGSVGGTGSPIIVTSSTNTLSDAISGAKLQLKKVTPTDETVTVTTDIDVDGIKEKISAFIKSYNDVMDYVDKQNTYDSDAQTTGVLFGDSSVQSMQSMLSSSMASIVSGLSGKYNQLAAVGIRTGVDGNLAIKDSSALETALRENPDYVANLLTDSAVTSSSSIEFVSSTQKTKAGIDYEVNVTSAATQGRFQGSTINDPTSRPLTLTSTNNRIKLSVNGTQSEEIILEAKTYASPEELVAELQAKITADSKIGSLGVSVSWMSTGDTAGHLVLESSTYGSSSEITLGSGVTNNGFVPLGLAKGESTAGQDVKGTINGEAATGAGQYLTGKTGNKTTEGLKLKVTLDSNHVQSGVEGTVSITRGVAARLAQTLDSLTKSSDGFLDRRISSYQKQVDDLKTRVTEFDAYLKIRREDLTKRYQDLESVLGQLSSTSSYLTSAFANMSSNWISNSNSNSNN